MKKIAIYTFIDAFGYEIYKQHSDFLQDIVVDAKPLKSVLGFTNTCLPSILSGQYPQEHEQASFFLYSKNSPFKWMKALSFLPKSFDRFRVRNIISKIIKKLYGYTGYFQLYSIPFEKIGYFDFTEKRDYFVPGAPFETIFDHCVEHNIPYHCSDWRQNETTNLTQMHKKIEEAEISFGWLYLPSLDGVMHQHGTQSSKVTEKINWLDQEIRSIYEKASENYDEVSLYVFSDHGMYDVTHGVNVIAEIDALGLEYGKDYVAMYDATMGRFWFKNEQAKEKITATLLTIKEGQILSDNDLKDLKCYFEDRRFGELFFIVNPKVMISPSYFGNTLIKGMHGYHPDASGSNAMLLSNQKIEADVNSITDIRSTMEKEITSS